MELSGSSHEKLTLTNENEYLKINEESKKKKKEINKRPEYVQEQSFFKLYWKILKLSFKFKYLLIFGNLALILSSATQSTIPYLTGRIIDSLVKNSDEELNKLCIIYIIISLTSAAFGFCKTFFFDILGSKVVTELRIKLFERLLRKDVEFYDKIKTGELVSRIGSDISRIESSSSDTISILIKNVIELFVSFYILFSMSTKLTLYILFVIPPIITSIIFFRRFNRKLMKDYQDSVATSTGLATEVFGNIRVVKSFSTESRECFKFSDLVNISYNLSFKSSFINGTLSLVLSLFASLCILFVLWIGGMEVIEGKMTSGQLSSYLLYTVTLSSSVMSFGRINQLITASAVSEKIFDLIDSPNKIEQDVGSGEKNTLKGKISLENVSFSYPSKPEVEILSNINLNIHSGEKIAIVGSSGSGKSTIVSLLERFYDCDTGQIKFDGLDVKEYNLEYLHKQIGFVSQEPTLFSGTIKQNIVYGLDAFNSDQIDEAINQANAGFVYDLNKFPLGLDSIVGERGIQLSGGQKQRVAIARALIKNPKILLFDEATSALDSESEAQVQEAINRIMKKGDTTMIIIAHRLSTIINCDRILMMANGRILEEGSHKFLIDMNGLYKKLFEKQITSYSFLDEKMNE